MLSRELQAVADELGKRTSAVLSLDDVAEALGTLAVSSDDIDQLFSWLEERGKSIGDATLGRASSALPRVLEAARELRTRLQRVPSPSEIAEHSGLSLEAVKRALLFSQILQR